MRRRLTFDANGKSVDGMKKRTIDKNTFRGDGGNFGEV